MFQISKSPYSDDQARDPHSPGTQPYRRLPQQKSIISSKCMRPFLPTSPTFNKPSIPHNGSRNLSPQCQNSLSPRPILLLLYTYVLPSPTSPTTDIRRIPSINIRTDFWGPASNFGIPIAAVLDTQKDPAMYVALFHYQSPSQ